MWDYTIKAEVVTGRFSRQVETFVVSAKNLTDAMIQIEKNVKIGRVIHSTSAKNKGNEIMELLCDSHHGQFIPQIMARCLYDAGWSGIELENVIELEAGPYESEWYWEAWESILNNAVYIDENNQKWFLHHDGDLFAATQSELENSYF